MTWDLPREVTEVPKGSAPVFRDSVGVSLGPESEHLRKLSPGEQKSSFTFRAVHRPWGDEVQGVDEAGAAAEAQPCRGPAGAGLPPDQPLEPQILLPMAPSPPKVGNGVVAKAALFTLFSSKSYFFTTFNRC